MPRKDKVIASLRDNAEGLIIWSIKLFAETPRAHKSALKCETLGRSETRVGYDSVQQRFGLRLESAAMTSSLTWKS